MPELRKTVLTFATAFALALTGIAAPLHAAHAPHTSKARFAPTVNPAVNPAVKRTGSSSKTDCGSAKSTPVASFPFNPFLMSEVSPPVIEPQGSWRGQLDTGKLGAGVAYLIGSRRPALMPTRGGMLLVELSEAKVLQAVRFAPGQDVDFHLPIPDQERLCSQRVRVQAVIVTPGGTYLSNAFDLTLGR